MHHLTFAWGFRYYARRLSAQALTPPAEKRNYTMKLYAEKRNYAIKLYSKC